MNGPSYLFGAAAGLAGVAAVSGLSRLGLHGWAAAAVFGAAAGALVAADGARWRRLSLVDPGTGLFNRRYLFDRLERDVKAAHRTGRPLSFIVVDVDNMGLLNKRHGHHIGDAMLSAVAEELSRGVRKGDTVGRWGGEEFGLILPGAALEEALRIAERIRSSVERLAVETGDAIPPKVTVSAGAASTESGDTLRGQVNRADRAMLEAKQLKNRVVRAG